MARFAERLRFYLRSWAHLPSRVAAIESLLANQLMDQRMVLSLQHKTQRQMALQIAALIRTELLSPSLPYPAKVGSQRFHLMSQNEEDGITWALLREAGVVNQTFVELGSGRSGGNSGFLALECGWRGLMVDASETSVEKARIRFASNPQVTVVQAFVTPENVDELLASNGFAGEADLLSLDIDSADYYVWEALSACSPRVVILEYNAMFGPERSVTVPKEGGEGPKGYQGASLTALAKLSAKKGYRLILCEPTGINAFFLRDDVAPHIPGTLPQAAFRPATSRKGHANETTSESFLQNCEKSGLVLVEV